MSFLTMSHKELNRISVLEQVSQGQLSQRIAADVLKISTRQVRRLSLRYAGAGAPGLMHRGRGAPSNRRLSPEVSARAVALIEEQYRDFGPTLASEKLSELHGLVIGKETVRRLMTSAGLWVSRAERRRSVHVWRERRACAGELVQLDGSHHPWFEDRAPKCCLIGFIDDATSRLLWAEFAEGESTESLMRATWNYLKESGRPREIYTDRGGVYKVNIHNPDDERITQYGRALGDLGIALIHARSPQAKGRVERLFGTLQDRLVKELRLRGIATIEEANIFLKETYRSLHNERFAIPARELADVHRSLEGYALPEIFSLQTQRLLQADWCIAYRTRWFQCAARQQVVLAKREPVTVSEYLDGSIHLNVRRTPLVFTELTKRPSTQVKTKKPTYSRLLTKPTSTYRWDHTLLFTKPDISKRLQPDISTLV